MEHSLPSHRRLDYHYIALQMGYWAMFAGICAYQAALLQQRGFSNGQIGIIIAVRCLAGIVCQPLLGGFADRHPTIPLKRIVALSLSLSLVASLVFLWIPMGLGGTLFIFVILGGFEISAYPLMDSMAVQYINMGVPIRYSLGRGLGSLAYACTCIFLGMQVARTGVGSTLVTHTVLVVLVIFLVITYPTYHPPARPKDTAAPKPQSVLNLLRGNPKFTVTLVAVFLGMTATIPLSNFLVNIVESRGGSSANLGIALFLMAASELPTAFIFKRMLQRFGSSKLILISMLFCTLKPLALLCSFRFLGVLAAQPLQMLGYGLFTPTSVFFVNESVPEGDRVRGQTIMMVASNGLGGVVSSALGGWALDAGGANALLVLCLVCGGAATVLALVASRMKNPMEVH